MSALEHLLSPINIRGLEIPNRAVMPPMGTWLGEDNFISDGSLAYMRHMADGGTGLIIVEVSCVHPTGLAGPGHIGIFDDKFIPGLRKCADVIHEAGGKAVVQLHHAGRESFYLLEKGEAVGPSAIPSKVFRMPPQEMSKELIQEVIEAFGSAAVRAREAGFDAVEVHGAHGYLLMQFLSAMSNERTDEYGGKTLKERSRFMIEVLESVRDNVGEDFPILLRLSAEEAIKGGYVVDDILPIIPDLIDAGADCIHASIGTHGSPGGITSAAPEYEPGFNAWRARKIKEAVDLPVIAVGRFNDPVLADEAIARGEADMVALGRQHLADPYFLKKAKEGRLEDIRKCIACNQGCIDRIMLEPGTSIRCAINPRTGQELIYPEGPASESRKVWVVGAGPAGLIAAQEAHRLGHEVSLFEEEERAGGNLLYASQAPFKQIYGEWISWLISQVEKTGVRIQTGTRVTEEMIDEGSPDVVILAVGGEKITPEIPGMDLPLVCDAWQILDRTVSGGKNALVVGGGMIGMETADFLRDQGSKVTLVEMLERSPVTRMTSRGYWLHKRLRDGECGFLFGTNLVAIQEGSVTVEREGNQQTVSPVDQVVLAVGMKTRDNLKAYLRDRDIRHSVVGDALEVRSIIAATEEGARAAWEV
jgi:2,4-dienoyl-CoA reductase-like NADH-dependent reductase (Old Yellow Enzyme family)/thioredoxin reductase